MIEPNTTKPVENSDPVGAERLIPKLDCNEYVHVFFVGKLRCECGKYRPVEIGVPDANN